MKTVARKKLRSRSMARTATYAVARKKRCPRSMALTAAYVPAEEGGYVAEILEATGVHSQGGSFEEARANLLEVISLMLEEAPHQFGDRDAEVPPGALTERIFVLLPQ